MAALSGADRTKVWRGVMRYWSAQGETVELPSKFHLYNPVANTGIIAKLDDWIDTHSANTTPDSVGFNGAMSVAERGYLTASQKAFLLAVLAAMRVSTATAARLVEAD